MRTGIFLILLVVAAASCFPQKENIPDKIKEKIHDRIKDYICKYVENGPNFRQMASSIKAHWFYRNGTGYVEEIRQSIMKNKMGEHLTNSSQANIEANILSYMKNASAGVHVSVETGRQLIAETINNMKKRGGSPLAHLIKKIHEELSKEGKSMREHVIEDRLRNHFCGESEAESEESSESEGGDEDKDEGPLPPVRTMVMAYARKVMALTDALTDLLKCSAKMCYMSNRRMAEYEKKRRH